MPDPREHPPAHERQDLSDDAFLGGALQLLQPRTGYRAGLDAVLLAAAAQILPGAGDEVLDAGAGVGTVGLCVARRVPAARVALAERDPGMAELARRNIARNGLADTVRVVEADVLGRAQSLEDVGLGADRFAHVLANPPFHDQAAGSRSPRPAKDAAHAMPAGEIAGWTRFLVRVAAPGGLLTLIHKPAALPALLASLDGRFGGIRMLPVLARPQGPAIRILLQGRKASRAPLVVLAPLVLHETTGNAFTREADAILRHGARLPLDDDWSRR